MPMISYHNPVLLHETINGLNLHENATYADATFGGGGHSAEILKRLNKVKVIAFDQDADALANAPNDDRLVLIQQNFRYMKNFLRASEWLPIDGVIADLGVSSHQFDVAERGFSIRFDGPLDMRMNQQGEKTAASIINTYTAEKLTEVFKLYGEIRNARQLVRIIEKRRTEVYIHSTMQLIEAIKQITPPNTESKFLAQVFQALRIEVNDELSALQDLLMQLPDMLKKGGRACFITYHSLEDRLVKNFFRAGNISGIPEKDFYGNPQAPLTPVNKKPIVPGDDEVKMNKRARSAKLRIAEKN